METLIETLALELGQKTEYVQNVVTLLDEGNTIPFIARYRKELHGSMDDTTLRNLETRLAYLRNLQERKAEVTKAIETQGKLTEELAKAIKNLGNARGWWNFPDQDIFGNALIPVETAWLFACGYYK